MPVVAVCVVLDHQRRFILIVVLVVVTFRGHVYRAGALCQAAFEAERKDRMEREGRIQSNLSKHEHETMERFEAERVRAPCVHKLLGRQPAST